MLISNSYVQLNKQLHRDRPGYGTGGSRWADTIKGLVDQFGGSVLDYGCGKGALRAALPFPIGEYDPAVPGKDGVPLPANIVVCTDVLEHIEPENLRSVLRHIAELTGTVAFLNISTRRANKYLNDGRNAHLIVNDSRWWRASLSEFFDSIELVNVSPQEYNVLVYVKDEK